MFQAKVVVLGDSGTGKSQLINSLSLSRGGVVKADSFFKIVELPAEELENTSAGVLLKFWEHSIDICKQEEELAFRGALFCIVTFDIRDPLTANSAFNKWISLRDSLAAECFLFVVGTFLDQSNQRRVNLKDVCKASAKKDAIYIEISNSNFNNILLLMKLIKQRLNYMLQRKNIITQRNFSTLSNSDDASANTAHTESNEEVKESEQQIESNASNITGTLHIPSLEQNLLCNSVGSIMSSCLDRTAWSGLHDIDSKHSNDQIEADKLKLIGERITCFIEQLSFKDSDENSLFELNAVSIDGLVGDEAEIDGKNEQNGAGNMKLESTATSLQPSLSDEEYVDSAYTAADLRDAFAILGIALPSGICENNNNKNTTTGNEEQTKAEKSFKAATGNCRSEEGSGGWCVSSSSNTSSSPLETTTTTAATTISRRKAVPLSSLKKVAVKLPNGISSDMVLDLEANLDQQIDLFLLSHSLENDDLARQTLLKNMAKIHYHGSNRLQHNASTEK